MALKPNKIKVPKQLAGIFAALRPVAKHHYFIVTVILFGSLAYAAFTVNQILAAPDDDQYRTEHLQSTIGSKFNQSAKDTIEKIKALQKSTDAAGVQEQFPSGRINPFAE